MTMMLKRVQSARSSTMIPAFLDYCRCRTPVIGVSWTYTSVKSAKLRVQKSAESANAPIEFAVRIFAMHTRA